MPSADLASVLLSSLAPQGDGKAMGAAAVGGAETGLSNDGAAAASFAAILGLTTNLGLTTKDAETAPGGAAPVVQSPSDDTLAQSLAALIAGVVTPIQVQPQATSDDASAEGGNLSSVMPGAAPQLDPKLAAGDSETPLVIPSLAEPTIASTAADVLPIVAESQASPAQLLGSAEASTVADARPAQAGLPIPQPAKADPQAPAAPVGPSVASNSPAPEIERPNTLPQTEALAVSAPIEAELDASVPAQAQAVRAAATPQVQAQAQAQAQAQRQVSRKPAEVAAKSSQAAAPAVKGPDGPAPLTVARPVPADSVATLTETAVSAVDDTATRQDPAPSTASTPNNSAAGLAAASAQTAAAPAALAADAPKVTAHTVAHLAAQIVSNVEGKATRFDVTLTPEGLGKVDVRVQIGVGGDITAQLNFANADAAAQMQSRAGDLHAALEQAGFDPSRTALSFNSGGAQQGPWQDAQSQQQYTPAWSGRAFSNLAEPADEMPAAHAARPSSGGVDVRI